MALSLATVASAKKQICIYTNEGQEICYDADKVDSLYFFNDTLGMFNLHEYVDLGLPSGTKWATTNIGAKSPEEYGDYFYWGGTTAQKVFAPSTTLTYKLELEELIKKGYCDKNGVLTSAYDAATCNWGDGWRMPTVEDCEELTQNTTNKVTEINGVVGVLYTSKINGKSVFFPNAGYYNGSYLSQSSSKGEYWSSTYIRTSVEGQFYEYKGQILYSSGGFVSDLYRERGLPIRPVTKYEYVQPSDATDLVSRPTGTFDGYGYVDLGLKSGNLWATCNIGATLPQERGSKFKWGGLSASSDDYIEGSMQELINNGVLDANANFTSMYDPCIRSWSTHWKTPSSYDYKELIENTKQEFIEIDGIEGLKITGPNGNSIFMPAEEAKELASGSIFEVDCRYWTSTPYQEYESASFLYNVLRNVGVTYANDKAEISNVTRDEALRVRAIVNPKSIE